MDQEKIMEYAIAGFSVAFIVLVIIAFSFELIVGQTVAAFERTIERRFEETKIICDKLERNDALKLYIDEEIHYCSLENPS